MGGCRGYVVGGCRGYVVLDITKLKLTQPRLVEFELGLSLAKVIEGFSVISNISKTDNSEKVYFTIH